MIQWKPVPFMLILLGGNRLMRVSLFGLSVGEHGIFVPYFLNLWYRRYSSGGRVASFRSLSILVQVGRPVMILAALLYSGDNE